MDVGASFSWGYNTLRKHPSILVPMLLFWLLTGIAVLLAFANPTVATEIANYRSLSTSFAAEYPDHYPDGSPLSDDEANTRTQAFEDYLEKHNWGAGFDVIFSPNGMLLFLLSILVCILAFFYALSAQYIALADVLRDGVLHWPGVLGETTRRFIPSVFGLALVPAFILIAPVAAIIALIVLAFQVHPVLGLLLLFLGALGAIAWVVFASVKLTLVGGAFYVTRRGIFSSTKESWASSAKAFWSTVILMLMFVVISQVPSNFLTWPLFASAVQYLSTPTTLWLAVLIFLYIASGIAFAVAHSFASAFFCAGYASLKETIENSSDVKT